jgi:hypothetical protein
MRKRLKHIFFTGALMSYHIILAQPAINGPVCVLPGVTYQYSFSNTGSLSGATDMRVCITGGSIVSRDQVRISDCVESEIAVANVLVMWNDTTTGSVTVTAATGSSTLSVNLTSILQPGILDSATKNQSLADTVTAPATIICSAAIGGSCSPSYSYQWQRSSDMLVWTNVGGATGQNLSFDTAATHTIYYRRKIVENNSGTIGYSEIATINVL